MAIARRTTKLSEPAGSITANPRDVCPGAAAAPALTVINGAAGGGRAAKRAPGVIAELRRRGVKLDVRFTEGPGHAVELARRGYADGYRRFVAVGGDGTLFEVINGIFPRPVGDEEPVVLGQLPLGTGNSFLRDFGITEERAALHALIEGKLRQCDLIRGLHRDGEFHFINLLAVGFPAQVCALTNERFKPFGAAGYAVSVLASLFRMQRPTLDLAVDGVRAHQSCTFLSFSNSAYTGGTMKIAPDADVSDGVMDIVRVEPMTALTLVRAFPSIYEGTHVLRPDIHPSQARRVEFVPGDKALEVMVDGEVLRVHLESLEVVPRAVQVIA